MRDEDGSAELHRCSIRARTVILATGAQAVIDAHSGPRAHQEWAAWASQQLAASTEPVTEAAIVGKLQAAARAADVNGSALHLPAVMSAVGMPVRCAWLAYKDAPAAAAALQADWANRGPLYSVCAGPGLGLTSQLSIARAGIAHLDRPRGSDSAVITCGVGPGTWTADPAGALDEPIVVGIQEAAYRVAQREPSARGTLTRIWTGPGVPAVVTGVGGPVQHVTLALSSHADLVASDAEAPEPAWVSGGSAVIAGVLAGARTLALAQAAAIPAVPLPSTPMVPPTTRGPPASCGTPLPDSPMGDSSDDEAGRAASDGRASGLPPVNAARQSAYGSMKKAWMRWKAVSEFVTSEQTYLFHLRNLVDLFALPLRQPGEAVPAVRNSAPQPPAQDDQPMPSTLTPERLCASKEILLGAALSAQPECPACFDELEDADSERTPAGSADSSPARLRRMDTSASAYSTAPADYSPAPFAHTAFGMARQLHKLAGKLPGDNPHVEALFADVASLPGLHARMLASMVDALRDWDPATSKVGRVLQSLAPFLAMYARYTANYAKAAATLHELEPGTSPTTQWIKGVEEAPTLRACGSTKLTSLLIMPVQRPTRYVLLVNEALKHTPESHPDYKLLVEARNALQKIAMKLDEGLAQASARNALIGLASRMLGGSPPIAAHRSLVREGSLRKMATSETAGLRKAFSGIRRRGSMAGIRSNERHVVLLSDMLLYGSAVSDEVPVKFKLHQQLKPISVVCDLSTVSDEQAAAWGMGMTDAHRALAHAFIVHAEPRSVLLCADNEAEQLAWVHDIERCCAAGQTRTTVPKLTVQLGNSTSSAGPGASAGGAAAAAAAAAAAPPSAATGMAAPSAAQGSEAGNAGPGEPGAGGAPEPASADAAAAVVGLSPTRSAAPVALSYNAIDDNLVRVLCQHTAMDSLPPGLLGAALFRFSSAVGNVYRWATGSQ